jgi:glycyl-tRNA synthetase
MAWYDRLGIERERLRFHKHSKGELAHYAKDAFDIEYNFPFGWNEIEGIHNRTDFDLGQHQKHSGRDMQYFDHISQEKYIPYIIETSVGCDRILLTTLIDAYDEEEERVILRFAPIIAPIKVAVFPLVKRDGMPEIAKKITEDLSGNYKVFYDDSGSIGRRYRRMDEAGTPYCITVDSESLQGDTITIRYRDSMKQERIGKSNLNKLFSKKLNQFQNSYNKLLNK